MNILKIIKHWRQYKLAVILLIIGYSIGILILSIGISVVNETRNYSLDKTSGNPDHSLIAVISSDNYNDFKFKNILSILTEISKNVEVQILNFVNVKVNKDSTLSPILVPLIYTKTPEWQIPIIKGRHFTKQEIVSSNKNVIIGKKIAEKIFPNDLNEKSFITINNEMYKIIGVTGREYRDTQWDTVVYIPINALDKGIKENFENLFNGDNGQKNITLFIKQNAGSQEEIRKISELIFSEQLPQSHLNFEYDDLTNKDDTMLKNSIILTTILAGTILFIAIVNVINLTIFWVLDRRKEIAVKKAIGATEGEIAKSIIIEQILISLFSTAIALIIQRCIFTICYPYILRTGISLEINWSNLIISAIIALLCGLVASIKPVFATLKMEPAEALRID